MIPFFNTSKYSVCCIDSVSGDRIISTQFWPPLLPDLYPCPFSIVRHVKGEQCNNNLHTEDNRKKNI